MGRVQDLFAPSRYPHKTSPSPPPLVPRGAAVSSGVLDVPLFPTVVRDAEHLTSPQKEVLKLIPLSESLAAWKLLPGISAERVGLLQQILPGSQKGWGLRPILDLRGLNHSVKALKFKMLTVKTVVTQIQHHDWFVTIDLKDAYFHIEILPQHRKFLRFAFGGEAYQFRGIRVLNYIDDWLILAQSREIALQHRDIVLAHVVSLGLRLNTSKSVLSPAQRTTYLGIVWDSITMRARLSPARIETIRQTMSKVRLGQEHSVHQYQKMLGLMASASTVIPLGLLHMRPFQLWLKARGFHPRANPRRQIKVTRRGLRTLSPWLRPRFLTLGPTLGAPCRRRLLTTDASLVGWGAVLEGRPAQGKWEGHQLDWHINCLELMAVFLALKYFLHQLRGCHVLVRVDNTAAVSYLNHQGGLRSRNLNRIARQIFLWAQDKFLSLRAVYIPGQWNVGADLLSRQTLPTGEWKLHPEVVKQIWTRFYEAEVDLFASQQTAQCPLYFSLSHPAPLGLDAMAHSWPNMRLAALAEQSMVLGDNISPRRLAVGDSGEEGPSVSGGGNDIPSQARSVESSRLAPEGNQLRDTGLSPAVIETILSARAPSTRKNYAAKWGVFERWCVKHNVDPVNCQIASVLDFMQEKLSTGTCPATLRGYVAALSACHALIDGAPLGSHPLLSRFLRGARRLRPPVKTKIPSWDLAIVLEGLVGTPFEPLESASDKLLTLKMVFLMAITSLKRIGDMQALSISPSCLDFAPGMVKVILHPHPDYLPKVPFSAAHPVILEAFCPPPFITPEQEKSHSLVQSVFFRPTSSALASGVSQSNSLFVMVFITGEQLPPSRLCLIGSGMLLLLPMRRAVKLRL
ncbi:Transposon Ty3-G Gag-Pol polyprotein [Labeo rohita]|uniref:Transposon Ty3-G Gag-Pol polyprotein n=1 Tax=Labeo rohita TaxID=84645 RepID=A0ABQ8N1V0_LABRO|nr:Transposon Ty3-G Gag-Pol polyprotein [Labeo rohita]